MAAVSLRPMRDDEFSDWTVGASARVRRGMVELRRSPARTRRKRRRSATSPRCFRRAGDAGHPSLGGRGSDGRRSGRCSSACATAAPGSTTSRSTSGERGRGYGRAAMTALEDEVRALGFDGIGLNVWGGNDVARWPLPVARLRRGVGAHAQAGLAGGLDRVRDLQELPLELEALREVARERLHAEPLGRVVAGRDEVDAELARGLEARLLGLAGEEEVVALVRRLDQVAAAAAARDRDALDLLGAGGEDDRLAARRRLATRARRTPRPCRARAAGRPGRPPRRLARRRRRALRRAGRCCRSRDARRARGGTRRASGRRAKSASSRPRWRRSTTGGSLRQKRPWWTSTSCAPAAAARSKSSSDAETPQAIFVTSSAPTPAAPAARTPGSGAPRAARWRSRGSRRGGHRPRL